MFLRGNMHLSARSELKSELADSRIETKLPMNQGGVLHACLGDVGDSHAGGEERRARSTHYTALATAA
jgi:hypothetical protein